MNFEPLTLAIIGGVVVLVAIIVLVILKRQNIGAAAKALIAKPAAAETAVKSFASRIYSTAELDAEKAASIVREKIPYPQWPFHPNPVAPAGVADVTPPASAASAGGGGTTVLVTAADAVTSKQAQLDAVIATHQAAIVVAQEQKAAVAAAQDALNKLVA